MTTSSTTGPYTGESRRGTLVPLRAPSAVYGLPRGFQSPSGQRTSSLRTAGVAELVDALDLGSSDASRVFHGPPGQTDNP